MITQLPKSLLQIKSFEKFLINSDIWRTWNFTKDQLHKQKNKFSTNVKFSSIFISNSIFSSIFKKSLLFFYQNCAKEFPTFFENNKVIDQAIGVAADAVEPSWILWISIPKSQGRGKSVLSDACNATYVYDAVAAPL